MKNSIDAILCPKSIAIVGATDRPGSVGLSVFANLLDDGYKGIVYPVNAKARSVRSVRAYPTLLDVPDEIDLAVIMVPAPAVLSVAEQAAEKEVKGLVVITAGFKEIGYDGVVLETSLSRLVKARGIRMIGPNCLGVINTNKQVQMNASFGRKMPKRGNIAFISQSGALCTAVLDFAEGRHVGFSKFISFGNKADVSEIDLIRYLEDDPDTDVILMYLEDITHGREFIEVAREVTWQARKPVLALKSGRSSEGARAAASHTGSLAGSDSAYDAIFFQSGIIRVEGINELFDYAVAFGKQPIPRGRRIAIVTNAGGPGIMATDAAIRYGLSLVSFSEDTKKKLQEVLPPTASVHNPVDVIGDATHERYEAALHQVMADESVDGAIVILTPQAMTDILETAEIVPRVAKTTDKPILCSFMGVVDVSEGVQHLEQNGIPNYPFCESAARSMAAMVRFGELLELDHRAERRLSADREAAAEIIRQKLTDADYVYLAERDANEILQCYGFPLLRSQIVTNPDQVARTAMEVGYPVVMKIHSPDIVHKVDAGGVRLNITTDKEAGQAYRQIVANAKQFNPKATILGVLVEKMAQPGVEVILGSSRDPKFGPVCMFGLGGTYVEVFKDVTFRLAPMWEVSADKMITGIKSYPVLTGVRGNPPSDIEAVKECILRLSQMVSDHPEIFELDINPLIVHPEGHGCVVADSRIVLKRP
ncbi:MAG TPA: acetate--CoA ligase family protein [Thermodesulfobacteriota bacterium]|nr:acetate--CoA ligase family protein [Thermodesulfobacteriota bacterium]